MKRTDAYERFAELHRRSTGFVMPNAWDAASALYMKEAGFEAVGTSSAALAAILGRPDGAHAISRQEEIDNAILIGTLSHLPVNGDFEDGFGPAPEDCALTVEASVVAGLAGIGIEDTTADPVAPIHAFDDAVERMRAAARVAKGRIVLTGRTDNFQQGREDLEDTIRRLTAFAEVGADVLYAPRLPDMASIRRVVQAVAPKPLNVVVGPASGPVSVDELLAAGVKRISLGSALYRHTLLCLRDACQSLAAGDLAAASQGIPLRELGGLIERSRRG